MDDVERDIFEAWLKHCEEIGVIIIAHYKDNVRVPPTLLMEKGIDPYHYFRERFLAQRERSGKGTMPNAGTVPPAGAASGSTEPGKTGEGSTPDRGPDTRRNGGNLVKVRVTGDTKPHATMLKMWHLRWNPNPNYWHGAVRSGELEILKRDAEKIGLKVEVVA